MLYDDSATTLIVLILEIECYYVHKIGVDARLSLIDHCRFFLKSFFQIIQYSCCTIIRTFVYIGSLIIKKNSRTDKIERQKRFYFYSKLTILKLFSLCPFILYNMIIAFYLYVINIKSTQTRVRHSFPPVKITASTSVILLNGI